MTIFGANTCTFTYSKDYNNRYTTQLCKILGKNTIVVFKSVSAANKI